MEAKTIQLTNRHLAKLLDKLDEIHAPSIIKDTVKSHFWWYAEDLETARQHDKEQGNETNRR